ncbi:PREDICTED: probable apyrase 6 isoform X1 [Tarenaya hassleriana]|uniref:probable apyrase 6 isoform X2 n=1 Tax=Tarenaya hassleriana TaxID=28532 RepID=UPI00053C5701|nr:PREDICTED: probable apyrase 6 isoform X2 [Tarenaya hassleriana]XP_010527908.1 PREDICTED: probable apyrase 6 isoform X1 [Tarenaya hassleriana]
MRRSNAHSRVKSKSDRAGMDPIRLQTRPGNRSSSINAFARANSKNAKSNPMLTIASIATAVGFLFVCYSILFPGMNRMSSLRYSVVIDGGSTGTRIHVFGYRIESGKPVFDFRGQNYASLKVNPGLSAYAEDPDGADVSLSELVEFAKRRIPKGLWIESEIRLMATAGMRLLELPVQERILEVTRRVLRTSGFKFRDEWSSVISGSDEGIYAWVVANYALGTLGGDPLQTTGIIELGGASAQVTFLSSEPVPPEFSRTVSFGNFSYSLYSHSFLHFGQNAAHEKLWGSLVSAEQNSAAESVQKRIFMDPCIPKGYDLDTNSPKLLSGFLAGKNTFTAVQAGGNFSECRSAALAILQDGKDACPYQHCSVGSTFTPKLRGKFLATENFFYTSKFFGLGEKASLSDLIFAGEKFCGEDWSKLRVKNPSLEDEDLLRYCFSSAYIAALLHDSLGISPDDGRVIFTNQAGEIPLDWALGAFILNTAMTISHASPHHRLAWFDALIGQDSTKLLYLVGIPIFLAFSVYLVSKWRKPQLKTVYDLEKGRYIVTRVR